MFAVGNRASVVNAVEAMRDDLGGFGLHAPFALFVGAAAGTAAVLGSIGGAGDDTGAAVACEDEGTETVETVTGALLRADFGAGGGGDEGCYGGGTAALGLEREEEGWEDLVSQGLERGVDWDALITGVV